MERSARQWAHDLGATHVDVVKVGYFGSYARGDWGVGSDLDVLIFVSGSDSPFERRGSEFPPRDIPVPCDVLVYTQEEWLRLLQEGSFFAARVDRETVWLYDRNAGRPSFPLPAT